MLTSSAVLVRCLVASIGTSAPIEEAEPSSDVEASASVTETESSATDDPPTDDASSTEPLDATPGDPPAGATPPTSPSRQEQMRTHERFITGGAMSMGGGGLLALIGGGVFFANVLAEGPVLSSDYVVPGIPWGVGGAAVVSGAVVLSLGVTRQAALRRESTAVVLPWSDGRGVGATLTLRF